MASAQWSRYPPPYAVELLTRSSRIRSTLDDEALATQVLADPIAKIALELDRAFRRGSTGATGTLQLLTQLLQKGRVVRQAVDDRDGLATAALFLHTQLRDDSRRNRRVTSSGAAFAIACRPSAAGTDASDVGGIDDPPGVPVLHDAIKATIDWTCP